MAKRKNDCTNPQPSKSNCPCCKDEELACLRCKACCRRFGVKSLVDQAATNCILDFEGRYLALKPQVRALAEEAFKAGASWHAAVSSDVSQLNNDNSEKKR